MNYSVPPFSGFGFGRFIYGNSKSDENSSNDQRNITRLSRYFRKRFLRRCYVAKWCQSRDIVMTKFGHNFQPFPTFDRSVSFGTTFNWPGRPFIHCERLHLFHKSDVSDYATPRCASSNSQSLALLCWLFIWRIPSQLFEALLSLCLSFIHRWWLSISSLLSLIFTQSLLRQFSDFFFLLPAFAFREVIKLHEGELWA